MERANVGFRIKIQSTPLRGLFRDRSSHSMYHIICEWAHSVLLVAFCYCQGIRGLKHLTPRHNGLIVKSTATEESRLGMKGKTIVLYYRLWLAKEQPLLDPQVEESLNPIVSRQPSTNCARSTFSEGGIFHLPTPTTVDNRLVYWGFCSLLSTKKCTER